MMKELVDRITDVEGSCIAIIIRSSFSPDATTFYSEPQYSLQMGIIKYPKTGKIKPHFHNEFPREVDITQEILVVRKGSMRVDLYDKKFTLMHSVMLHQSDAIFLVSGGHGFEMLEDCELLEIKQGPYSGVKTDKTHFDKEEL